MCARVRPHTLSSRHVPARARTKQVEGGFLRDGGDGVADHEGWGGAEESRVPPLLSQTCKPYRRPYHRPAALITDLIADLHLLAQTYSTLITDLQLL